MKILLIEDEAGLQRLISDSLTREHFVVECVSTCQAALEKINDYDYDCVLLDIMLPDGNGLSVLSRLKAMRKGESVIIISARDSLDDKVEGLDLGADDYLAKPFHLAELNARVKSVLRRQKAKGQTCMELGNLQFWPNERKVMVDGTELKLNRKELDLLYYLISNPNRLINRTALAESVWGDRIDQADSLDFIYSQMKNLRRKLKEAGAAAEIKAVYGFGYKLVF
ncbi:MAG: response regulator transcription factor [Bacteroidaceae bacterium]